MKRDPIRERVLIALRQLPGATSRFLAQAVGHPYAAATVTAKLRDLRKQKHGGHKIACRRCPEEETGNGYVYRYWLEE